MPLYQDPTFAFLDVTRPMTAKERERLERFAKEAKDESQWGTSESMGSASGGGSRGSTITGYSMAKSTKRDAGTGSTFDRIREQKRRAGHDKVKSRLAGFLHRGGQFTNASESQ